MGPVTQTQIQTSLCAALAGATLWAVPQSTSTPPLRSLFSLLLSPLSLSVSISQDLCWTVAQQAVEKPFYSNSKRQKDSGGSMRRGLVAVAKKVLKGR